MRRTLLCQFLILFLMSLCHTVSVSAEEPDSLSMTLDEVVVQGRTQRVIKYGVEYMPDKQLKKSAIDAVSLLFRMQIPQLNINPVDMSVKTASGGGVDMFIDYIAATPQDLQGIRPEDVLRVEVLEYPQDPRFNSSPHVVNFIMRRYEWGGYTKLTASGRMLNDESVSGALYQKFEYKNWTFDASADAWGAWADKYRDYKNETLRDFTFGGNHYDEVSRISSTTDYSGRNNGQKVSLRGARHGKSSFISHTVSFSRTGAPENTKFSEVSFSDNLFPAAKAVDSKLSQSISVAVKGHYTFSFKGGHFLLADWSFGHSGNRNSSCYTLAGQSPISNRQKEAVYSPDVTLAYSKDLGRSNTFRVMGASYANFYDTHYFGSYSALERMISSESMMFLEYMQNWRFGLSLYSRIGLSYVFGRLNGVNYMHEWGPRLGLQLQQQINSRNSVSLEGWWANSHPEPSISNSAIIKTHELLWIQGNPDLKNICGPMLTFTYNYIPTNSLSFSASVRYDRYMNMPLYYFRPVPGYEGIVRTYNGDNDDNNFSANIAGLLRLCGNKLSLYAAGQFNNTRSNGFHPVNEKWFTGKASATGYLGNFSVNLYYETPTRRVLNTGGYITRIPAFYMVEATYGVGNLKASLRFSNWFNDGRDYSIYNSPYYTSDEWSWKNGFHRSLNLTVSYTFPYGKKTDRMENIDGVSKKSAILQ